jgi:hypothetical protein
LNQAKAAERREAENTKAVIVQVDDLLTFRQFSKKSADDAIDVRDIIRRQLDTNIDSGHSMMKTLGGRLGVLKSAKISYLTLVVFLSSLVRS